MRLSSPSSSSTSEMELSSYYVIYVEKYGMRSGMCLTGMMTVNERVLWPYLIPTLDNEYLIWSDNKEVLDNYLDTAFTLPIVFAGKYPTLRAAGFEVMKISVKKVKQYFMEEA